MASPDSTRVTGKVVNSGPARKTQAEAPRREGELIVRFREDVTEQGRSGLASSAGGGRTLNFGATHGRRGWSFTRVRARRR